MTADAIKTMKLYSAVERIHDDLADAGYGRTDALPLDALTAFDQLHYFGTEAVDEAVEALVPPQNGRVLDIGSGFGGPARWFANRTGATVSAVELQADLNRTAADLTKRTEISGSVEHVCGDILEVPLAPESYDGAISFLALYHIPDREPLFPRLNATLKPGSAIYVEDLYTRAPLNADEADLMRDALYSNTLPDKGSYIAELEGAGFTEIDFQDMSDAWGIFCAERLSAFRAVRDRKLAVHGEDTVAALDFFYATICRLFDGRRVGGVRIKAHKPA